MKQYITLKGIISLILYVTFFVAVTGCRSVKIDKLKEELATKTELQKLEKSFTNTIASTKTDLQQNILNIQKATINQLALRTNTKENETTTIKADVKAEEGKEKSVSFGGTKITSNGFNVSVETTTNKEFNKELENYKEASEFRYSQLETKQETTQKQLDSTNQVLANFIATYQSEKNSKTRTVSKKQIGLGILGLLLLFGAYILLRKKFNWLP